MARFIILYKNSAVRVLTISSNYCSTKQGRETLGVLGKVRFTYTIKEHRPSLDPRKFS
jgi:hypothetical protein